MTQYVIKVFVTALIVVAATELAKCSTWLGALLLALPLTSLLAMFWLYYDTRDATQVAALAQGVFWLVLPTLPFFLIFPWAVGRGWGFWTALGLGCVTSVAGFSLLALGLRSLGIRI
jgi:hypothetical protein